MSRAQEPPEQNAPADDLHQQVAMHAVHIDRLSAASELHDETLKRVLARLDALEARTLPTAELSTEEMRDRIEGWYATTRPRRRMFTPDGWVLADPDARFAAAGPETDDDAFCAAYWALRKAGQL